MTTQFVNGVTSSFHNFRERVGNYFHPPPPVFNEEEIAEFMALTFLTRDEILRAYTHFCSFEPQFFDGEKNPYLSRARVMKLPEFRCNPFRQRMMTAYSSYEDFFTFEDYLEMMSAFSDQAPVELKAEFLFRIYDFDHDDMVSIGDLVQVVKCLVDDKELEEGEMLTAAIKALMDGDVDGDGVLAFSEFVHLIQRLEDFKSSFTIHV